ncbi:MAG: hypothetical protein ABSE96_11475 [Terracidiphilus sp.]
MNRFLPLPIAVIVLASAAGAVEAVQDTKDASKPVALDRQHPATLAQLMRATLYTESNVVFAAQTIDPATIPRAQRPSAATDPLNGVYGNWEAVENESLAMAETASLLEVPGRVCSNGRPVPVNNADWVKLVDGLRDASMKSYEAAKSKSQDNILEAADVLTTACANCHQKYRDKAKLEDRCK